MNYTQHITSINNGQYDYYFYHENNELSNKIINTNYLIPIKNNYSFNKQNINTCYEEQSYNECINKTLKYIEKLQNINVNIKHSDR